MKADRALVIFARYPRLGQVKTRLTPALPASQVLRLYEAFLLDTLESAISGNWQTHLYLGDCSQEEELAWRKRRGVPEELPIRFQKGPDLGERLWNACQEILEGFSRIVFIGADTPGLPSKLIEEAFLALERKPVAIGPVPDGGYYLLGLAEPRRELFEGIDWGSESVFEQTLSRIPSDEAHLLAAWNDIDEAADLAALEGRLEASEAAPAPRTLRCLRQLREGRLT